MRRPWAMKAKTSPQLFLKIQMHSRIIGSSVSNFFSFNSLDSFTLTTLAKKLRRTSQILAHTISYSFQHTERRKGERINFL